MVVGIMVTAGVADISFFLTAAVGA